MPGIRFPPSAAATSSGETNFPDDISWSSDSTLVEPQDDDGPGSAPPHVLARRIGWPSPSFPAAGVELGQAAGAAAETEVVAARRRQLLLPSGMRPAESHTEQDGVPRMDPGMDVGMHPLPLTRPEDLFEPPPGARYRNPIEEYCEYMAGPGFEDDSDSDSDDSVIITGLSRPNNTPRQSTNDLTRTALEAHNSICGLEQAANGELSRGRLRALGTVGIRAGSMIGLPAPVAGGARETTEVTSGLERRAATAASDSDYDLESQATPKSADRPYWPVTFPDRLAHAGHDIVQKISSSQPVNGRTGSGTGVFYVDRPGDRIKCYDSIHESSEGSGVSVADNVVVYTSRGRKRNSLVRWATVVVGVLIFASFGGLLVYCLAMSGIHGNMAASEADPTDRLSSRNEVVLAGAARQADGTVAAQNSVCDSPLYCEGDILTTVQLADRFKDSKRFVDMPTIRPVDDVVADFYTLVRPILNDSDLAGFLDRNFRPAGAELKPVRTDADGRRWRGNPTFLDSVADKTVRKFTAKVIDRWADLVRQDGRTTECTGCGSSLIRVPNPFVVPGGRFRESYYWDSYWIVLGLVRSGGSYVKLAGGMIDNMLGLVDRFGFVPNGARTYYLTRSQVPMLTQMVEAYVRAVESDVDADGMLARALPVLNQEYEWWMNNRAVKVQDRSGKPHVLNRYSVSVNHPRPESYLEDFNSAGGHNLTGDVAEYRTRVYSNIASAAESGWDFSSRWLSANDGDDGEFRLNRLATRDIVPVDLNAVMYANEVSMSRLLRYAGQPYQSSSWVKRAEARARAIRAINWNEQTATFVDYDLETGSQIVGRNRTYASSFFPLWAGLGLRSLQNDRTSRTMVDSLSPLWTNPTGNLATSTIQSGQQWDGPNVWPPLVQTAVAGLLRLNRPEMKSVAVKIGQAYFDSVYCTFQATKRNKGVGAVFEKYSADSKHRPGGGGEYEVVSGFGWSNGVLIWLADQLGGDLVEPQCGV